MAVQNNNENAEESTEKLLNSLKSQGIDTPEKLLDYWQMQMLSMDAHAILNPPKPEGNCILCGKPTTDWDYCYGCKKHVCQECTENYEDPRGKHHYEDHQRTLREDLL